jgi:hypothetical protein
MRKRKTKKSINEEKRKERKCYCSACGREIDEEEYESYDEMCWECWDDQMTEESDMMFGDVI